MVTIRRKNLLASCLFLLGYSSFFLLAVSGSYDYTTSWASANEPEPLKPAKHRDEWLSNHEWDYSSLKRNYHSRRKSRSTLESETSRVEGTGTEETSQGAAGEWVPRKERTVERFVGPESIGNASGFVQEEKEKDSDAIKNTTMTIEPIESDINLLNETQKEISDDEKSEEKKDRLKDEVSVEEGERKNATDVLGLRSMIPHFHMELGQESPDYEPNNGGYLTQRRGMSVKIPAKEFFKEILRRKNHRRRKGGKKGSVQDIEFVNSEEDDDEDFEEKEEEDEDTEDEEEETDHEESGNNGQTGTNVSKMISDMFLPMRNNENAIGRFPWRGLTSSKYTKQVMKQDGPHLKQSTKETKSKVSLFFANDPGQTSDVKNNSINSPNIDDSEISRMNRSVENALSERMKSTSESININTTEQVEKITTTDPMILPERKERESSVENVARLRILNENDRSDVTIYRILDTTILLIVRILSSRDEPILDWY